ncbi:MAG: hypothetical protein QOH73_660 [Gaiellaceae bacterium]|jgi:hypothetical protein|nr:hypothetical protein [Gaiellaceae bacterium]
MTEKRLAASIWTLIAAMSLAVTAALMDTTLAPGAIALVPIVLLGTGVHGVLLLVEHPRLARFEERRPALRFLLTSSWGRRPRWAGFLQALSALTALAATVAVAIHRL